MHKTDEPRHQKNRGSYMSVHVILNLLKELGKSDKMQGFQSILFLFARSFEVSKEVVHELKFGHIAKLIAVE